MYLYRPGRPPKRMTPITTFASMPNPDPAFLGAMSNTLQGGIPFPPPQQHRDLPPGFNPFLHLGGSPASQAAQMAQHAQAQAAMLSRNGLLPGANPRHEEMLEKYGHMLRHLQGWVGNIMYFWNYEGWMVWLHFNIFASMCCRWYVSISDYKHQLITPLSVSRLVTLHHVTIDFHGWPTQDVIKWK